MPHNVEIPQAVIDRAIEKRGKLNVFDRFEPEKSALLVIDMQNFFVDGCEPAASIVPNINKLADGMRARGVPVIWIQMNMADVQRRKKLQVRTVVVGLVAIVGGVLLVHFFITPIDVLWFRIVRKLEVLTA